LEFEGVVEKALTLINSNLINFISQFSKLRCGRYFDFRVDFVVVGSSNKLQKLGCEKGKI
jgi:hypothetical protein